MNENETVVARWLAEHMPRRTPFRFAQGLQHKTRHARHDGFFYGQTAFFPERLTSTVANSPFFPAKIAHG